MSSCVLQYTHIHAVNSPLDVILIKKITLITILPYITTGHTNTHTPSGVGIIIRKTFSSDQKKP